MTIRGKDLTVIVPSFNMQNLTERAVASVLENSSEAMVLVVDDASDPPIHLPDWEKVRLIRHNSNLGAASARNTGVGNVTTPWISFLDADDVLLPNTLERRLGFVEQQIEQLRALTNVPTEDVVAHTIFGCGWLEKASGTFSKSVRIPRPAATLNEFASGCWYCPGSAIIAHRSVFGGEDKLFSETLRRLEDFEWGLRFAINGGQLVVLEEAGVAIEPSNRVSFDDVATAAASISRRHKELQEMKPGAWRSMQAYLELEKATAAWRDRSKLGAMSSLLTSYWQRPRFKRHFSPGWTYRTSEF